MIKKDIKTIRADMEIVRESQNILFRLKFSIAVSTRSSLKEYLRKAKRQLVISFVMCILKMSANSIVNATSTVFSKAISVLLEIWLRIKHEPIL